MISVQVIIDPAGRPDWLAQCLASLQGQGVEIVIGQHVPGSTTTARLAALERQHTDWVSWVDPDDIVPPRAFEALGRLAAPGVGVVTGDELSIRPDGTVCGRGAWFGELITAADIRANPRAAHKGLVHRDAIPLARQIIGDAPYGIEWALMLAGTLVGEVRKVCQPVYHWRKHTGQSHRNWTAPRDWPAILARFDALKAAAR